MKKQYHILLSIILTVLGVSFPVCSPLILLVFPVVFELMRGETPFKNIKILLVMNFITTVIVFLNPFFIVQYRMFLLASLYFSALLSLDFIVVYQLTKINRGSLFLIFLYCVVSRIAISLIPSIFPFYWTLTMQLLPIMNGISRFLLPVFFEGIIVVLAAMVYLFLNKRLKWYSYLQPAVIILCGVLLSLMIKANVLPQTQHPKLECSIIQGGFSSSDYTLIERYPVLAEKIANGYVKFIEDIGNRQFIILPESAFPIQQGTDGQFLQAIEEIAASRQEYILTSILLNDDKETYNALALINPQGQLQDVYKKRNVVLFVETDYFAKGKTLQTFSVYNSTVAPMICFDSVYIRNYFRDKTPDIYIVASNDVFAEKTILSRLHQGYSVINARTMGIPLIQVIQNGPSFYVDSQGELITLAKPYEKAVGVTVEAE
jgi:apolipoprotein N-acyltransferase